MSKDGWIGIDLDGTLAYYDGWKGCAHIGDPVPTVLAFVKRLIAEGETVKIFTARACIPEQVPPIKEWLARHGLAGVEVTNVKDFKMRWLFDDRATGVLSNAGLRRDGSSL